MARRRYVVTGREGQVVQSLVERGGERADIEIVPLGRPDLDLADRDGIASALEAAKPDLIVSAAAYTAVDRAEEDEAAAVAVNAVAPGAIGRVAERLGIPVIHLSTDYVFDGSKTGPYSEDDAVSPLGVYGRSKLEGERALAQATGNHAILRTAWVYSPFGNNFVKTMLRLAGTRDTLGVVDDQRGNPTSALDIADGILKVADNLLARSDPALRGVFNMSGQGRASWADFAIRIFDLSKTVGGPSASVNRIGTSDYPTPAKRPANSELDCGKIGREHGVVMPDWQVSAETVVRRLLA
ncbi:dTDP-4-dehydrorhamnose reductase [Hartmannibacter diazotrophicus]|uniref:dTDP-4-dehydrorhamnose reductase n=1 Tax=Hartmannibacter diazotrophicus TaxID=1482074 RepID=A0A2C9DE01_9HYPH|nr:dTDP-4-dehydrorhamnose reductase [Hartmannibacter diazotrophicus]SON57991.1 dTDP-4-dehydrorhamnose reductase [Hartmannibacter diazotrophicus]